MVAPAQFNTHEQRLSYFDRVWVCQIRRRLQKRGLRDPYAQDAIIQAVRLRIWRHNSDCENPKVIAKATSHSLIDYVRQQKSQTRMEATQYCDDEQTHLLLNSSGAENIDQPMTRLEHAELRTTIETQLSLLPNENAALIRRHYFAGEPLAQIGMSLGVSEGTVSKWLKAIRHDLAQCPALQAFVM